jgi:hypothetical protein
MAIHEVRLLDPSRIAQQVTLYGLMLSTEGSSKAHKSMSATCTVNTDDIVTSAATNPATHGSAG